MQEHQQWRRAAGQAAAERFQVGRGAIERHPIQPRCTVERAVFKRFAELGRGHVFEIDAEHFEHPHTEAEPAARGAGSGMARAGAEVEPPQRVAVAPDTALAALVHQIVGARPEDEAVFELDPQHGIGVDLGRRLAASRHPRHDPPRRGHAHLIGAGLSGGGGGAAEAKTGVDGHGLNPWRGEIRRRVRNDGRCASRRSAASAAGGSRAGSG